MLEVLNNERQFLLSVRPLEAACLCGGVSLWVIVKNSSRYGKVL